MGGFVAAPGGLMAKWLGIPLIIHEQNRVVGTTNRWLAKIADQVLEAFPDSFSKKYQAVCTGNPLRKNFLAIPNRPVWQAEQRPLHILVVGGSQGAKILNEIVPQAVSLLSNVAVKHQTGEAMFATVQAAYSAYQINAQVLKFIEDMNQAYQWADLIICRAGAMTVSEVAAVGLPAIFVPLPNAIDDHQTANARYLTESQAGILLLQKELTANSLANLITQNLTEFQKIGLVAKNKAWLNATETVANIVIEVARVDK
jgi:UDP-N-acetylglucosamine--N-acetylmuramyl-(pentapeptide) pyrophosphoryl-undecaprenol N-acetylglucosamine transferase